MAATVACQELMLAASATLSTLVTWTTLSTLAGSVVPFQPVPPIVGLATSPRQMALNGKAT
jgi:hypothetical protein